MARLFNKNNNSRELYMRIGFFPREKTEYIAFILLSGVVLLTPVAHAQVSIGGNSSKIGRIIHVHAAGSSEENAAALTAALQSSTVTSRTDPATQPVVIQLGPGVFEYPGAIPAIMMPDHVHISGAGRDATTITCGDGCYLFSVVNTTNHFRDLSLGGTGTGAVFSIAAANADVLIHDVRSETSSGVGFDSGSNVRITNSTLLSSFDDALQVYDANVVVEYSVIDGPDSSADGVIYVDSTNGTADLTVRHSYIGSNGVRNRTEWAGNLVCAYISGASGEVSGCPESPEPPPGIASSTNGIKFTLQ